MAGPGAKDTSFAADRLRLDKWLWQARFFKSRTLAAEAISAGHVRVNGSRITRPGRDVTPGDTLTFAAGGRIRVVCILALGARRGPASEAQALFLDLEAGARPATPIPLD
ncbi:RNA-binding S4 domain-containing protein [Fuscovulum blasticum]|uniref:RNA-binding S4 domain-containing protein n=1 Tax=Fuscovulum blasticum TaxID=1075 RepID=UPI000D3E9CF8|nr:RNA-binding S4 domain-containing protein [Fuscovulum blasticum]AWD23099.1 RNA-binding protein [Fuscovulum blasticum]